VDEEDPGAAADVVEDIVAGVGEHMKSVAAGAVGTGIACWTKRMIPP